MARTSPMEVLREQAEHALDNAVQHLGKMRQACASAVAQRERLEDFQQEYREQLQTLVVSTGIGIVSLINYGAFIESLGQAVKQQSGEVSDCQQQVDRALMNWKQDKKKLNALTTLKQRAERREAEKACRLDQKMMDEFAQRATLGRGK